MTIECLEYFESTPMIRVKKSCTLSVEKNMFKEEGGIEIVDGIRVNLNGVSNFDQIHSFFIGKETQLHLNSDLIMDSTIIYPSGSELNINGNLTVTTNGEFALTNSKVKANEITIKSNSKMRLFNSSVEVKNNINLSDSAKLTVESETPISICSTNLYHQSNFNVIGNSELLINSGGVSIKNFIFYSKERTQVNIAASFSSDGHVIFSGYSIANVNGDLIVGGLEFSEHSKGIVNDDIAFSVKEGFFLTDDSVFSFVQTNIKESSYHPLLTISTRAVVEIINSTVIMGTTQIGDNSKLILNSGTIKVIATSNRISSLLNAMIVIDGNSSIICIDNRITSMSQIVVSQHSNATLDGNFYFSKQSKFQIQNYSTVYMLSESHSTIYFSDSSEISIEESYLYLYGTVDYSGDSVLHLKNSKYHIDGGIKLEGNTKVYFDKRSVIEVDGSYYWKEQCQEDPENYCVSLTIKSTASLIFEQPRNLATFYINNSLTNIGNGILIEYGESNCVDLIYYGHNTGNTHYPSGPNCFLTFDNNLLRSCENGSLFKDVYCHLIESNDDLSLHSSQYQYETCPCKSNSDYNCFIISEEPKIRLGDFETDVTFVENEVEVEFIDDYQNIIKVNGLIQNAYFSDGIVLQKGDASDLSITKLTPGHYELSNNVPLNKKEQVNNDSFVIGEIHYTFSIGTNFIFYLSNSTHQYNPYSSDLQRRILVIAINGMRFENGYENFQYCSFAEFSKKGYTCLNWINKYCNDGFYLNSITGDCDRCSDNCIRCSDSIGCILCSDGFRIVEGKCEKVEEGECELFSNNHCYYCDDGGIVNGECNLETPMDNCLEWFEDKCYVCDSSKNTILNENENGCNEATNSNEIGLKSIISCKDGFMLKDNACINCSLVTEGCFKCDLSKCLECQEHYHFESSICVKDNCNQYEIKNEIKYCKECQENYMLNEVGKCVQKIDNCRTIKNEQCVECNDDFYLYDNSCKSTLEDICLSNSKFGCLSCSKGFYNDEITCEKCDETCSDCVSKPDYCISCPHNYYLDYTTNKCISNDDLEKSCSKIIPSGKCSECKDGYYNVDLNCKKCDVSCETCVGTSQQCIICNETNYMKDGVCLPKSGIVGCKGEISSINGCSECLDGYYHIPKECEKCMDFCATCSTKNFCLTCPNSFILQSDGSCLQISSVEHCLKTSESKCIECDFWYRPTQNGSSCEKHVEIWLVMVIISVIIIAILLFIGLSYVVITFYLRRKQSKELSQVKLFKISSSGMFFLPINQYLVSNITNVSFSEKGNEKIPIETVSKQSLCLGNSTNKKIKVQLMVNHGIDKYTLVIKPETMTLSPGYGCEFEINIIPHCSCKVEGEIRVICQDTKGNEFFDSIKINAETVVSSFIDYDLLKIDKIIGMGSNGVVSKAIFNGNNVAVKKMRFETDDEEALKEFKGEIEMLNKFRCEQIIYFYGACIIPNKLCVVTELADYGSLGDLIRKDMKLVPPSMKIRIKMMLNAAEGLKYLHSNGILHRDIKPENILVVSLEENISTNAKLTDFGSSRNINQIVTNLTFTKGVGTPKYMAPEVLDRRHYEKPADIYSFAVTMLETIQWCNAYDPEKIRAWDIADNVSKGIRPNLDELDEKYHQLINNSWQQNPEERYSINEIVVDLRHFEKIAKN